MIGKECGDGSGIRIPDGVALRGAEHTHIFISSHHGLCGTNNDFSDLVLVRSTPFGPLLELQDGVATLTSVSLLNYDQEEVPGYVAQPGLILTGTAKAKWTAGTPSTSLGRSPLSELRDRAVLEIHGGRAELPPLPRTETIFRVTDGSTLELNGVELIAPSAPLENTTLHGVQIQGGTGDPQLLISNSTFVGLSSGIGARSNSRISVSDSRFEGMLGPAIMTFAQSSQYHSSLDVKSCQFVNNESGIITFGNLDVSIDTSTFLGGTLGLELITAQNLRLTNCELRKNDIALFTGARTTFLRSNVIVDNVSTGAYFTSPAQTVDLGTASDPGRNVLASNGVAAAEPGTNLWLRSTAVDCSVSAVGNLWSPNEQGADSRGSYATGSTQPLEPTTGDGANYRIDASCRLLLAP